MMLSPDPSIYELGGNGCGSDIASRRCGRCEVVLIIFVIGEECPHRSQGAEASRLWSRRRAQVSQIRQKLQPPQRSMEESPCGVVNEMVPSSRVKFGCGELQARVNRWSLSLFSNSAIEVMPTQPL